MADFDNGLPPKGIDVSDKKITTILIDKDVSEEHDIENIKALLVDASEADDKVGDYHIQALSIDASEAKTDVDPYNIKTVLVDKSPSGHNRSFFF